MGAGKTLSRPSRPYASLEPRVANVSEAVIRKRWKKLPETSQLRLAHMLDGIARQGLANMAKKRNPRQAVKDLAVQDEGEEVVAELADRLTKRLPRMPFPPKTDDRDFDFEGTLQRVRMLEDQLTSNIHSVQLLTAQIKAEEDALLQDKRDLEVLEKNAKGSRMVRKHQSQKLHPLAREQPGDGDDGENETARLPMLDLDLENDKEAKTLVEQLRSHLESMRNNTEGTKEVVDVMDEVHAKLDIFSATMLSPRQYEMLHGVDAG